MTKDEALDLALNALLWANIEINDWRDDAHGYKPEDQPQIMEAIAAIKQARSAPVQEPVACGYDETTGNCTNNPCCYTTPPAAPVPDYAWPTVADYEKDVGFEVNEAFKMAWAMARTTNALFTQVEKNT
jgi:hypothetical protein